MARPPAIGLAALFLLFLRFGLLAFGGPIAQIAMIRRVLVEERRWIGPASFNRLLAVMQALPGPEAHELCVHLGIRARGRVGGLLAGLGFMLPGFLLILCLAYAYSRLSLSGGLFEAAFLGAQAAIVAVVLRAVRSLGAHILTGAGLWVVAAAAALGTLAGASFWIILPVASLAYVAVRTGWSPLLIALLLLAAAAASWWAGAAGSISSPVQASPSGWALFLTGLKAGLLTFGGAYAAIPFVRDGTVGRGWISDAQFLDGLALSSLLPAPMIIFATFAGWMSGGPAGALAITAGIFLPAFAFSLIFYERLESLAEHRRLQTFLAGIAAAVVGLIAVAAVDLARAAAERSTNLPVSIAIAAAALLILTRWRTLLATPLVLAAGALIGIVALR